MINGPKMDDAYGLVWSYFFHSWLSPPFKSLYLRTQILSLRIIKETFLLVLYFQVGIRVFCDVKGCLSWRPSLGVLSL